MAVTLDEGTERRVVHGLRHVATGRMVRVREVPSVRDEEVSFADVSYSMTLDESCPLYDAGSPGALAMAFAPTYGGSRTRPVPDGIGPADVTPVVVEEVVTRTVRAAPVEFEVAERFASNNTFSVTRALAGRCEGMEEILDAVRGHRAALEAAGAPGSEWPGGRFGLVGVAVVADAGDMPDLLGRLVVTNGSEYPVRRALGTVPLPGDLLHLAGYGGTTKADRGCAVVCLSDDRALPADLVAALTPADAPAPR